MNSSAVVRSPGRDVLILIGLFFLFRLLWAALLPLSPQEAYYWVYSLHPDWSYFDHPPLTAWTIGFFTFWLGHSAVAIRLGALLYAAGFTALAYLVGRDSFSPRVGRDAALLCVFLPTYSINALIMTPDAPLVFFWTLSLYLAFLALQRDRPVLFIPSGLALGLALLAKYTAVILPLSLGLFLIFSRDHRRLWKGWELYGGLGIALLVFSPVLVWNARHDWASLAFQSTDRAREMIRFDWGEFGAFWASQMGVLTPLVFAGMAAALGRGIRRINPGRRWPEAFLVFSSLPMIGLFVLVATREWVKMNWLIPAYLPPIILMGFYCREGVWGSPRFLRRAERWIWVTVLPLFLVLHLWPFMPQIKVSGSMDTLTGWEDLAGHLQTVRNRMPRPESTFILAWGHKTAAELEYHLPGTIPVVAQTALGKKALAYDYWFDPAPLRGRDALFVWSDLENFPDEGSGLLQQFFQSVEPAERFTVHRGRHPLRTFRVYRCYGYRGLDFHRP